MKKFAWLIFIFCLSLVSTVVNAQSATDSIVIEPSFFKMHYYQNGNPLKTNQVLMLMENDDEAYDLLNSSQEARVFGSIFGIIGTGLLVTSIGTWATGNQTTWALAWAGGGMMAISVPLFLKSKRQAIDAVNYYNYGNFHPVQTPSGIGLYFQNTQNGIGLVMRF